MKRVRTKAEAQLISKLNAYIIPVFSLLFFYVAFTKRDDIQSFTISILIGSFLLVYGCFRIFLIQKLMKDIEKIDESELAELQKEDARLNEEAK